MNRDSLTQVIRAFVGRELPGGHERTLRLPTETNKVIALAGVRRSGKTFLLFDTMRRLVDQGIDRRQLLYLSFEDDRLQPLHQKQLDLVVRCHREMFPELAKARLYLFLDEVQNAPGWERWVRRLHDTEPVAVFVTGSSQDLLLRDVSSAMRGRSVTFEVFPLSFAEFLVFRGLPKQPEAPAEVEIVRKALLEYLQWGGFPEVVLAEPAMKPLILEEYASVMLHRDLAERRGIRNRELMRALLRHCYRNTASLFGYGKVMRDLRSLGLDFSKNTLFRHMSALEDGGHAFLLPIHDPSLRKQAHNPKKLHVVDTGLINAFLPGAERDVGRKLETIVFLEARRRQRHCHYLASDNEVDLCDAEGRWFVNTCWNLDDPDTLAREMAAMAGARTSLPGAAGALVYQECTSPAGAAFVGGIPAWRWLLQKVPGGP
jgi:predicted AAA+ superfamily ATPase